MALMANCIYLRKIRGSRLTKTLLIMKFLAYFPLIARLGSFARGISKVLHSARKTLLFRQPSKKLSIKLITVFLKENLLQEPTKVSADVKTRV